MKIYLFLFALLVLSNMSYAQDPLNYKLYRLEVMNNATEYITESNSINLKMVADGGGMRLSSGIEYYIIEPSGDSGFSARDSNGEYCVIVLFTEEDENKLMIIYRDYSFIYSYYSLD